MKKVFSCLLSVLVVLLLLVSYGAAQNMSAPSHTGKPAVKDDAGGAPLFNNLGDYQHQITTKSAQTQQYFNQGLTLMYGFNHGEAIRSFKEAARLDPSCAMCYWGVAIALGPNINKPMEAADVPVAWEALQQAKRLAANVSENEQAYIKALEARYSPQPVADRRSLDVAYANAMREVMKSYPQDLDAATLFAEAAGRSAVCQSDVSLRSRNGPRSETRI
jgi:tetratricopeptide (TPR) repeat protein